MNISPAVVKRQDTVLVHSARAAITLILCNYHGPDAEASKRKMSQH